MVLVFGGYAIPFKTSGSLITIFLNQTNLVFLQAAPFEGFTTAMASFAKHWCRFFLQSILIH
jgi:hypothetical protein